MARLKVELKVEGVDSLTKLSELIVGPDGAIIALLLMIGYLMKELGSTKKLLDNTRTRYEDMREQRDEFRFIAGDAVRAGKRAIATNVAMSKHHEEREDREKDSAK